MTDSRSGRHQGEREPAGLERKLEGFYDAIADGLRSPGLNEKLQALEARRDVLRTAVAKPAPSAIRLHGNLAAHYRRKMAALAEALQGPSAGRFGHSVGA